jgi:hypothetical protein
VLHRSRPVLERGLPGLVTLKVRPQLDLRKPGVARALAEVFREHGDRGDFEVLRHRVLRDQVRLLVKADDPVALGRGMKSIAARVARAVNHARGRSGAVLKDRYELRVLRSRAEVRRALSAADARGGAKRPAARRAAKRL